MNKEIHATPPGLDNCILRIFLHKMKFGQVSDLELFTFFTGLIVMRRMPISVMQKYAAYQEQIAEFVWATFEMDFNYNVL